MLSDDFSMTWRRSLIDTGQSPRPDLTKRYFFKNYRPLPTTLTQAGLLKPDSALFARFSRPKKSE
jgi:hypothetical protein